ncbi:hypothetical protein MRS44_016632 [Fusarium solani]|uniref:uncharacterized protein n=1 Tax=Fusarium solani TaxID=169388 RepID=UPI0032C498C2|nr:hypothetical protein MRS44_016632 [Fusarium solani]
MYRLKMSTPHTLIRAVLINPGSLSHARFKSSLGLPVFYSIMAPNNYDPARDIPSLDGKVILITGGNIGLGKQSALDLIKHNPAEIWLAARNSQKADAAITELKEAAPQVSVWFLQLDLGSFESVKNAARTLTSSVSRLDILLLNAGVMGCPPGQTKEGYETHWGINHVGHALLLKLLTPLLLKTRRHQTRHSQDQRRGESPNNLYGQSKLANLIYAKEFAEHHPELTSVSIHPGTVKTDLQTSGGNLLMRGFQKFIVPLIGVEVQEGAKNQLWAATAKGVESGEYYEPVGVSGRGSALSKNKELGKKLWDWTEKEIEAHNI